MNLPSLTLQGKPGGSASMVFEQVEPQLPEGWRWMEPEWQVGGTAGRERARSLPPSILQLIRTCSTTFGFLVGCPKVQLSPTPMRHTASVRHPSAPAGRF